MSKDTQNRIYSNALPRLAFFKRFAPELVWDNGILLESRGAFFSKHVFSDYEPQCILDVGSAIHLVNSCAERIPFKEDSFFNKATVEAYLRMGKKGTAAFVSEL